jgi:hypothetical protein
MRAAVFALVLLGCSLPDSMIGARDAEAIPDGSDGGDAQVCPGGKASTSCIPYGDPCGSGGYRYGCYSGTCATGDVGACTLIGANAIAEYAETCCERLACVRAGSADDAQCRAKYDSGALEAWQCPWSAGKSPARAPGRCTLFATPTSDAARVNYCCAD